MASPTEGEGVVGLKVDVVMEVTADQMHEDMVVGNCQKQLRTYVIYGCSIRCPRRAYLFHLVFEQINFALGRLLNTA